MRRAEDGTPWVALACDALRGAGCREVIVVLGAGADEAAPLVPRGALAVVATDWERGQSASLAVGLAAASTSNADAVLVTLVDLPDQTAEAGRRVITAGVDDPRGTLARAHYDGSPGHPVLLGRNHWGDIGATLTGDSGARQYLHDHLVAEVDCSDLGGGADRDA